MMVTTVARKPSVPYMNPAARVKDAMEALQ